MAAERPGHDLDPPRQRVVAVAERRRVAWLEDRPVLDADVEQVVEPFVEQDVGVEDHDQVGPDHHLHHPLVEVEVDRARGLRRRPSEVEHGALALAPDRQLDAERAVALPVVVHEVLERLRRLGDLLHDEPLHRAARAVEQRIARGQIRGAAEPLAELEDPLLAHRRRSAERHDVRHGGLRRAGVARQDGEQRAVQLAGVVELHRRKADPLLVDRANLDAHRPECPAADIEQVPELAREADELVPVEDRAQDEHVRRVRDRSAAEVRVVLNDHVAGPELLVEVLEERGQVGTELPDEHAPVPVGDERVRVVRLADHGRDRRSEHDRIHLVPHHSQRVLDDLERDRVHCGRRHRHTSSRRRIRLRYGSTLRGEAGMDERRRVLLLDHGRAGHAVAGPQPFTGVDGRGDPARRPSRRCGLRPPPHRPPGCGPAATRAPPDWE